MPNDIANNMADIIHQLEKELKDMREENKVLTRDCLRLTKSNDKLRKRLKRMAEYNRLLKVMAIRRQSLKTDRRGINGI